MTGKKSDLSPSPSEAVLAELAYHDEAAARLEAAGNVDTYHHRRAAEIRAALGMATQTIEENDNGKLD